MESLLLRKESCKVCEVRRGVSRGTAPSFPPLSSSPKHPLWPRPTEAQEMTASDRLLRGVSWSPHGPAPGWRPGGRWLLASSPRGRILTRGGGGRAQQHRTEQERQPNPDPHPALRAATTRWSCRFLLCHHQLSRRHRRRLAAALPALVSFLRPFPGLPALAFSQSPPAVVRSSPNRRGLPAHLIAPPLGSRLGQSLREIITPAFPVGPRPHRHGPS